MSTVSTRLCRYGHEGCSKHITLTPDQQAARRRANQVWAASRATANARLIETIEARLDEGLGAREIATETGYTQLPSLRRHLYNLDRGDLARCLYDDRRPAKGRPRGKAPKCAHAGCERPARWVWDQGFDPDDEPIAHWGYLCRRCQDFENLAEDVEFLLDPLRGNESSVFNICARVGYEPSVDGLDTLRQRMKRHGRFDLRDALNIDSVKGQQRWHAQGTVRSDINNHFLRLVAAESVRAYERQADDPGRKLIFK